MVVVEGGGGSEEGAGEGLRECLRESYVSKKFR